MEWIQTVFCWAQLVQVNEHCINVHFRVPVPGALLMRSSTEFIETIIDPLIC